METKLKVFFLGGNDLEMETIRQLLIKRGEEVVDDHLGWGAKASTYENQIWDTAANGNVPILVELEVDIDLPGNTVVVDHHGARSGEEASILQIRDILGTEPTRRMQLVAANDVSGFFGLRDFGATLEEIKQIMWEDRKVQGFTPQMEAISAQAVTDAEYVADIDLTIVHLPFSKFAAAKAILWLSGHKNIVCVADDGEIEFQGDGAVAQAVSKEFTSSNPWSGGAGLGHAGRPDAYVGMYADADVLVKFVKAELKAGSWPV
ncbi:hypothetical protein CO180_02805 [candidate division WWE3 bacterium CG_4_9_14_3_um_filter_41_6]|nr:MAG: hypothetical protein CO180_02805 [candidate division WWE3 bacterium CG_4_9_14_3_um_filter_41_6]